MRRLSKEQIENLGRRILRITLRKQDPKKIMDFSNPEKQYPDIEWSPEGPNVRVRRRLQ